MLDLIFGLLLFVVVFSAECVFLYEEPKTVVEEEEEEEEEKYSIEEQEVLEALDRQWEAEKVERKDYREMKVSELREIATGKGILWRNAHGKNKHLKKNELLKEIYRADRRESMMNYK